MARSKNSLNDVSPASGQLKSSFSNLERAQLDALKQTSSVLGYGAGTINGDVTNALRNFSYRDRSKLEIGGLFAEGLEKTGITRQTSGSVISSIVSNSIDNRKPFYRNTPNKEIDLSIPSNRVPDPFKKSPQELMKETRESLVGRDDLNYGGLTFPPDLLENAHAHMALKLYKYHRPSSFSEGTIDPAETIYLPLPDDFTQNFAVNYSELETGMIGMAAATGSGAAALNTLANNFRTGQGLTSGLAGAISENDLSEDIKEALKFGGFSTLSSASPVIGGLVGAEAGMIANPHPSLFLNGVNLRRYSLAWKLVPRSSGEAEVIKKILSTIKKECLPKKKDSFLTYPKMIQPEIRKSNLESVYKKSMLAGLNINYAAEGTSAFFYDGNPVSIQLTLELQEAELYLEDAPPGE